MTMGLLTRMLGRSEAPEARAAFMSRHNYPSPDSYMGPSRASAGVVVNERSALSHSVIYSAARLLADAVSGLPLDAYDEQPDGSLVRSKVQPEIVADPFAEMSRQAGLFSAVISCVIRGNLFGVIIDRDPLGYATKVMVCHPDWVTISRQPDTGAIVYTVNGTVVANEDILHVPTFVVPGNPIGLSPIEAASGSVALGIAQDTYSARYFEAGATLSGVLEVPGEVDQDKATRIVRMFSSKHSGVRRSHAVGLLSGGATFRPISSTPEQSQLLGSKAWSATELAMLIGVPPHLLGLPGPQTFAGAGLESIGRSFVTYSLRPHLTRFEDAWSKLLPAGQVARFSTDALTAADLQTRYAAHHLALSDGWKSVNEVRAEEGKAPIEGGDVYMRPLYLGEANTTANPANTTPTRPSDTPAPTATQEASA